MIKKQLIILALIIIELGCSPGRQIVKTPPIEYYKNIERFQTEYLQGKISLDDYRYLILGEDDIYGVKSPCPCMQFIYSDIQQDHMPIMSGTDNTALSSWFIISKQAKFDTDKQLHEKIYSLFK